MNRRPWVTMAVVAALSVLACGGAGAVGVTVTARTPSQLTARLTGTSPGKLYRVTYQDGKHTFVWENLQPDAGGEVQLADDRHLRPEYRLRCQSRTSEGDPVVFDDFTKGLVVAKRRLPFGVPVSTFGGPGYLTPGLSELTRDEFGNFWLYLDRAPYAVLKYDAKFRYQFALLLPDRILAQDVDAAGDLYLLHAGNWISKHDPLGGALMAWELPFGREAGQVIGASGMVIDRANGRLYLADEILGRVQRFDLDLNPKPIVQTAWGWIGREDLTYSRAGVYDADTMYYQLDRPRQLRLDGEGHLFVASEHYVSKFDLATGKQLAFGHNPVLGWGGSFTDSAFSPAAGLDGHWERLYLAGIDSKGRIYIGDRQNEFVLDQRLQVFTPEGDLDRALTTRTEMVDSTGERVSLTAVIGLASHGDRLWVTEAGGHIYESQGGLTSGGKLHLGPGAAGRQFDLSRADEKKLTAEAQEARVRRRVEGKVVTIADPNQGTTNCERMGVPTVKTGDRSMWLPVRLGEPFTVKLKSAQGQEIPASGYTVEYEETPGAFGTQYDYFRVTNRSGTDWEGVQFVAEAAE